MIPGTVRHPLIYSNDLFAILSLNFTKSKSSNEGFIYIYIYLMISYTVRHSLIYSNDLFAIVSLHFPKEYIKTFPLYSTWSRAARAKNASSFFTRFF